MHQNVKRLGKLGLLTLHRLLRGKAVVYDPSGRIQQSKSMIWLATAGTC